jgi:hypothetical protein
MGSQVLRRLTRAQLLTSLQRRSAAPFHVILWDSAPLRLADAVARLERAPEDSYYYASPERVFSSNGSLAQCDGTMSPSHGSLTSPAGIIRAARLAPR